MGAAGIDIIKIISSLPGRVRVNVKGLLKNEQRILRVRSGLTRYDSILSFHVSKNTGNVLIYYNENEIDENKIVVIIEKAFNGPEVAAVENIDKSSLLKTLIDAVNPFFLFKKKLSEQVYRDEYSISSKILKISMGIAAIVFVFTGNVINTISIFVLSYPGILFGVRASSYYYASVKLNMENIYLKDNTSMSFLSNVNTLLIEDDIFRNGFNERDMDIMNLNEYEIQKLVILGKLDDPINDNMKLVIDNIRMLGINNIFIIGNSEDSIIRYIGYVLGIEVLDKNDLDGKKNCLITDKSDSNTILIVTGKFPENELSYMCSDCVICLYNELSSLKADINLKYSSMDKLILLIKLGYFCREVNVQVENTAITLNILGILLAVLNHLTPLYSIIYYILNTLLMVLILKLKFDFYESFNKIPYIKLRYLTN